MDTYPNMLIRINAMVPSSDWPVYAINISRMILDATARPPAPRIPMTRIFFFVGSCRPRVNGNGTRRMIRSLTTLTTASAMMMER